MHRSLLLVACSENKQNVIRLIFVILIQRAWFSMSTRNLIILAKAPLIYYKTMLSRAAFLRNRNLRSVTNTTRFLCFMDVG